MKATLLTLATGVILMATTSCGTGKKLKASTAQNDSLRTVISDQNTKLSGYENDINQLNQKNAATAKSVEDCNKEKEAISKRADELNKTLTDQKNSMEQIRKQAAEALNKFQGSGVEVTTKDGLVYISMQDKLLFNSGSAQLGKEGKEALSIVGQVLNSNPGVKVTVVGNTDSIDIKKAYKDNWSLSTERANSIVRILRDSYEVDPARLTASGRSKYDPVEDNMSPEGRAKNRRTDIILNPDLSKLWSLVETETK
jgi:chemotaxis protein MotB